MTFAPLRRRLAGGRPRLAAGALLLLAMGMVGGCWACSPVYVLKAGVAEARILRARQFIPEVVQDTAVDPGTRAKLTLVLEARAYAADVLGIDVGDAYTTFTQLDRDTLALVVSAAERDRLVPRTWWFPVVHRVPYRGFFSLDEALAAQSDLEDDGYDTYVRPTAAFSTLGWFNDPVLSTALKTDEIEVVETVLHELSHNHLFVPGQVGFNESFATFVGRVGAIRFFCSPRDGVVDEARCARAEARWRDYQRFSVFVDEVVEDLHEIYGDSSRSREEKLDAREAAFARALSAFDADVAPTLEEFSFAGFRQTPLNNATLLARIRYFHRLPDFDGLLQREGGDLPATLAFFKREAGRTADPFSLLPRSSEPPT
ncbi:MAG: aminopeptidase [Gemmatimonadota bacterium]|nr:aminopeptidase [Gemmatimonadota bacterium]